MPLLGAHVTILARSKEKLEETRRNLDLQRVDSNQRIDAVALDLVVLEQVGQHRFRRPSSV